MTQDESANENGPPSDERLEASHEDAAAQDPSWGEVFRRLGPAGYLGIAWLSVPILGTILLWGSMGSISDWLRANQALGVGVYVLIFIFSAGFGLLPTYAQALLGGWVFGVAVGGPAAVVGVTGAAMVGYVVARMVSQERAQILIAENAKAQAVRDALIGHGFWKTLGMVTLIRLPANSPFALTNLVMSSTGVPKGIYLLGTMVGMAPRTVLAAFIASGVQELTQESAKEAQPKWVWVVGIGLGIAVIIIIAKIAKNALAKVARVESVSAPEVRTPDVEDEVTGSKGA